MKIGILTTFSAMVEHYSLTGVVLDQARMIHHAGHEPVLLTMDDFKWDNKPEWLEVRSGLPTYLKIDYATKDDLTEEHLAIMNKAAEWLQQQSDLGVIFTHDVLFTGWNLPIGMAVHRVAPRMETYWLHWVHSIPGGAKKDFWRLPVNGKLVYPNHTDRIRCAEHFRVPVESVEVIPHSVDARNFLMKTDLARSIATDYDLMSADFVQTYPVPTDRMEHKGIVQVLEIFGHLKAQGHSVRVVFCNAWCTKPEWHDKVEVALTIAQTRGLTEREVIFTSRISSDLGIGVPNEVVRDLMLVSNLFVCPTKGETFGIAIAEAALCGQLLVLNSNVPALPEIAGAGNAIYFTFGSHQQRVESADWNTFYSDAARIIARRFRQDDALKAKTHYRQNYNMDAIWNQIAGVIQAEAVGTRWKVTA